MKNFLFCLCIGSILLCGCKDDAEPSVLEGCCDNLPLNTVFGSFTRIYVSNIFTPNGDNINDLMTLSTNSFVTVMDFEVKDKDGTVVHTYTSPIGQQDVFLWDGEVDGEIKKGFYTYTLTLQEIGGAVATFEGGICNYPCDTDVQEVRIASDNCTFPSQESNGVYDSTLPSGELNACFSE